MAKRAAKRAKRQRAHETYIVAIERSAFDYSLSAASGQQGYRDDPELMLLTLWGRFAHPKGKLFGAAVEITLYGDRTALPKLQREPRPRSLGSIEKSSPKRDWQMWAHLPLDVLPHLARSVTGGELPLAVAIGEPLFRNRARIWIVGLHARETFQRDWGEPLPLSE